MLHEPEIMCTCDGMECDEFINTGWMQPWNAETHLVKECGWLIRRGRHFCSQACVDSRAPSEGDPDDTSK